MSPSTFWSNLRTLGLVTLVTVLIWVWADAETQKDDLLHAEPSRTASVEEAELTIEKLPVLIALPSGQEGKVKWGRVWPQDTNLLGVTIAGPRTVIDRLRAGDASLRITAVVALDDRDWDANVVDKAASLLPGGLGLRFVGPAPTVRVALSR